MVEPGCCEKIEGEGEGSKSVKILSADYPDFTKEPSSTDFSSSGCELLQMDDILKENLRDLGEDLGGL